MKCMILSAGRSACNCINNYIHNTHPTRLALSPSLQSPNPAQLLHLPSLSGTDPPPPLAQVGPPGAPARLQPPQCVKISNTAAENRWKRPQAICKYFSRKISFVSSGVKLQIVCKSCKISFTVLHSTFFYVRKG